MSCGSDGTTLLKGFSKEKMRNLLLNVNLIPYSICPRSPLASRRTIAETGHPSMQASSIKAVRFPQNPLITTATDPSIGTNINGPSLVRVPSWIKNPLGRYYLYFAHHQGAFIRLAYADRLEGPWRVHPPGVLHLDATVCRAHIASPDVHVMEDEREIRMYFHGPSRTQQFQRSYLATSTNGLHFEARPEALGPFYFRVFRYGSQFYALAKTDPDQQLLRSRDGIVPFQPGPRLLPRFRHTALFLRGDELLVFGSRMGDNPERIVVTRIDLRGDWTTWREGDIHEVLAPEEPYEGGDLPAEASVAGAIHHRVRQLRDPGIFCEDGRAYLQYSIAGESGIAMAELIGL